MALDHALARHLREGEAVLRLYGWRAPTVSLGRNEPARGRYRTSPDLRQVDFVRRPTGGRAVLHWRELTYAIVAPPWAWGGPKRAYVAINEALARALTMLGAPVALAAPGTRAERPDAGPCFRASAAGELVSGGRKVVGSAQARLEGALLQHGSILLEDDQGLLERYAVTQGHERPATLCELVGDVSIDEVAELVAKSLPETFGGRWSAGTFGEEELESAKGLEAERYGCDAWTWRR